MLKRVREKRKLSQREVGKLAGIAHTTIARIENGQCAMTKETAVKLTRVFPNIGWMTFMEREKKVKS